MKLPAMSSSDIDYFVCFYLKVQNKYLTMRKARNIILLSCIAGALLSIGLYFVNVFASCALFVASGVVAIPTVYGLSCKMSDTIETACVGNISYRVFKKLYKSGKLKQMIKEYEQQLAKPSQIGIEKLSSPQTSRTITKEEFYKAFEKFHSKDDKSK